MSAFGAVAEFPVADFGGGGTGATISIPVDNATWADSGASLRAGKRIAFAPDPWSWTDRTPSLRAGKRIAISPDTLTIVEQRTVFSTSAYVRIPPDALIWVDQGASARAGKRVAIPVDSLAWEDKTPSPRAGKRIAVPVDSMTFTEQRFVFSTSAYVRIPGDSLVWIDKAPRASAGVRIDIHSEFEATYNVGSVAEDAVACDALLAGIEFTKQLKVPDNLAWSTKPTRISSGGSAMIPAEPLTITEQRVEIGARGRKLRIVVAAS